MNAPTVTPEGFSLDRIADACAAVGISDSRFESLSIELLYNTPPAAAQPVQQPAPVAADERAAFESLCRNNAGAAAPLQRSESGAYCNYGIQAQWVGWEARSAIAPRAAPVAAPVAGQDTEQLLCDYLLREMPSGTVIGDPAWWAQRIAKAIHGFTASGRDAALVDPRPLYEAWEVQEAIQRKGEPLDEAELAYILKRWPDQPDTYSYCPHHWPAFKAGYAARPANVAQVGGLTAEQITDAIGDGLDEARDEISSVAWAAITKRLSAILGAAKEGPTT